MDTNKQSLLKIFSVLLKKKATEKELMTAKTISPALIKYFLRKDLVEMVSKIYEQNLPEGMNLLELENEEILSLIEFDYQIIIYMCEKWLKEEQEQKLNPKPVTEDAHSSADENLSENIQNLEGNTQNPENEMKGVEISNDEDHSGTEEIPDVEQPEYSENKPSESTTEEHHQEQTPILEEEIAPEGQEATTEMENNQEEVFHEDSVDHSKQKNKNKKHR